MNRNEKRRVFFDDIVGFHEILREAEGNFPKIPGEIRGKILLIETPDNPLMVLRVKLPESGWGTVLIR